MKKEEREGKSNEETEIKGYSKKKIERTMEKIKMFFAYQNTTLTLVCSKMKKYYRLSVNKIYMNKRSR